MQQLENNAYFWQKLDTLLLSSSCTIDRPKGSTHYKFTNLVYPVDYGFLSDTFGSDQKPIDVFKGSIATNNVDAIAITADILKKRLYRQIIDRMYRRRNNAYFRVLGSNRIPKSYFST